MVHVWSAGACLLYLFFFFFSFFIGRVEIKTVGIPLIESSWLLSAPATALNGFGLGWWCVTPCRDDRALQEICRLKPAKLAELRLSSSGDGVADFSGAAYLLYLCT